MANKKTIWEDIFGKDQSLFLNEMVDPESLDGFSRTHMIDTLYRDYVFYVDQKYDKDVIRLYEQTLSHLIKVYGH
tara:strand:- start:569 stop:793 length:225 start_codon:yes stop_codon:yes gene_type:complete